MKSTINFGIIGLGKIANKFAHDLRYVKDAKLHAVASTDMNRAAQFARQYDATYHFGSYEALLNCPHLDVVYIATPHVLHCANTLMCLRRRIPVICEKPFGMNAKEVQQMIDMAHQNQTFLMEAMWTRYMPSFLKAQDLVKKGVIGRPLSIKSDFGFYSAFDAESRIYNKDLGGGAMLDVGIYPATLALSILGKPLKINALAKISSTGVDENIAFNFQYENGAVAMGHASVTMDTNVDAVIYGEKGAIYFQPRFHHSKGLTVKMYDGKEQIFDFPFDGFGYQFEAAEVVKCLKNNALESPQMSHQFSMDLIETLDAVRREIGLVYPKHDE
jgi:predicted dehydrogenase